MDKPKMPKYAPFDPIAIEQYVAKKYGPDHADMLMQALKVEDLKAQLTAANERAEKAERERDEAIAQDYCTICGNTLNGTCEECATVKRIQDDAAASAVVEQALRAALEELLQVAFDGPETPVDVLDYHAWKAGIHIRAKHALALQPSAGAARYRALVEATKLIKDLEWHTHWMAGESVTRCLFCYNDKADGHTTNCRMLQALRDVEGKE